MRNLIFVCALMGILSLASAFTHPVTDSPAQSDQVTAVTAQDQCAPATTLALPDFAPVLVVSPTDPLPAAITLVNPAEVACACNTEPTMGCQGLLKIESTSSYYRADITAVDYTNEEFDFTYVVSGNLYYAYDFPFSKWAPNGASFIIGNDIQP